METKIKTRPQWETAYHDSGIRIERKRKRESKIIILIFRTISLNGDSNRIKERKNPIFWCHSCFYRIYDITCGLLALGEKSLFICDRVIDVRLIAAKRNTNWNVRTRIMQIVNFNGIIVFWMNIFLFVVNPNFFFMNNKVTLWPMPGVPFFIIIFMIPSRKGNRTISLVTRHPPNWKSFLFLWKFQFERE